MRKLKHASGQEAEFLRKALGSQPIATRWFEIVPVKVRQWTFHLHLSQFVKLYRNVEHMFLLVRMYQTFPFTSEQDGDVLVFESAGSASQFRRFVAATASWSEAGGQLFPPI